MHNNTSLEEDSDVDKVDALIDKIKRKWCWSICCRITKYKNLIMTRTQSYVVILKLMLLVLDVFSYIHN